MAILIQKKQKVDGKFKMVKLQLVLYTFFNNVDLTESELDCATLLGIDGFDAAFFKKVVDQGIFKSEQSVRNCMAKLKTAGIAIKEGKTWKINPMIELGVDNLIVLDLKAANV